MKYKETEVQVFGAEQVCASCVGMPSSKETYEWLGAALNRKFPNQHIQMRYFDIESSHDNPIIQQFVNRVIEEDLFYPIVLIEGEIMGEGNPRLKTIAAKLKEYGYVEGTE